MSDELEAEVEALRRKNRELLDELKQARAKAGDLEKLQGDLEAAQGELVELKLHAPVRALLDQVLIPPNRFAIAEVMDDYTFKLSDDGKVQMLDGDKPVEFTVEAITRHLGENEKYAGVVRSMARNESLAERKTQADNPPDVHFGIR